MKHFALLMLLVHFYCSTFAFRAHDTNECNCESLFNYIETLKKETEESLQTLKTAYENELSEQKELLKDLKNLIEEQKESIASLEERVQHHENILNSTQNVATSERTRAATEDYRYSSKRTRRPSKKKNKYSNKEEEWPKLTETDVPNEFSGCLIDLKANSPKYPPHLINEVGKIINPVLHVKSPVIALKAEERVTVACVGRNNSLTPFNGGQLASATCIRNISLLVDGGQEVEYSELGCVNQNREVLIEEGTCAESGTLIKVGWQAYSFIPLYSTCHDKILGYNLYSVNIIIGRSSNADDKANTRPPFRQANYFPGVDINAAFNQTNQNKTIAQIVKSETLALKYFNVKKNLFLSRGHLAPDGDFIDAASQDATYYYFNMAPQWQTFNGGNWNYLERAVRRLAFEKDIDFTVYTGTYGTSTLTDADGVEQLHYLTYQNGAGVLPVPKYYWKLIHDPASNTATAVVGINNPHLREVKLEDVLCEDVCSRVPWVNWKRNDFVKGYTFCCTAEELHKAIQFVPYLGDLQLLI